MNTTADSSTPPTLVDEDVRRRCYLTRFAFLMKSARRSEYDNEPVVGYHHVEEMASFFSRRHLLLAASAGAGAVGVGERIMPPCISSSSISLSSERDGGSVDGVSGMMIQPSSRDDVQDEGSSSKRTLLDAAAINMSAPFFTTPDTASSTATTVLKNLVSTMEVLVDSRLRSTLFQLVSRTGGHGKSHMILRLLSPSRRPIQISTVVTRFVLPDCDDGESATQLFPTTDDDTVYIPLLFKAAVDVKVFGESSTIEITCPVAMSGKFDCHDGLLNAVDVCFDCVNLLQAIIDRARFVVKLAMTKAASLSVQIVKWHTKELESSGGSHLMAPPPSMLDYLESDGAALQNPPGGLGAPPLNGVLHRYFSPTSSVKSNKSDKHTVARSGVLRKSSYGALLDNSDDNTRTAQAISDRPDNFPASTNANATFNLGGGTHLDNNDTIVPTSAAIMVRFRSPPLQAEQIQTQTPQRPRQEDVAPSDKANGNIHPGLFSWLRNDDSMFPNDAEMEEQAMIEKLLKII